MAEGWGGIDGEDRPMEIPGHKREIFRRGGSYVQCQVLNWQGREPPKYLVCNPLEGPGAGQLFLAHQGMGTWMEADLYMVAHALGEAAGERQEREKLDRLLREKDAAMGVLFDRLAVAGVDCSDLFP